MAKKTLTDEAQAMKDIYWSTMSRGDNVSDMWQEMFDTATKMRYSKLSGMRAAYEALGVKDAEALAEMGEELEKSKGVATKEYIWWFKERSKILKNKAKLSTKITQEKKRLNDEI